MAQQGDALTLIFAGVSRDVPFADIEVDGTAENRRLFDQLTTEVAAIRAAGMVPYMPYDAEDDLFGEAGGEKFNEDHDPDNGQFTGPGGGGGGAAVADRKPVTTSRKVAVSDLKRNAIEHGGATYNVMTHRELSVGTGRDGPYAIGRYPERGERVPLADFKAHGISRMNAYVRKNADLLRGDAGQTIHLGVWVSGDRVVFDCTVVVPRRDVAMRLARDADQESMFDLGHAVEIPTGGAGGAERAGGKAEGRRLVAMVPLADLVDHPDVQQALVDHIMAEMGTTAAKSAPVVLGTVKELTRTATGWLVVERPLHEGEAAPDPLVIPSMVEGEDER